MSRIHINLILRKLSAVSEIHGGGGKLGSDASYGLAGSRPGR